MLEEIFYLISYKLLNSALFKFEFLVLNIEFIFYSDQRRSLGYLLTTCVLPLSTKLCGLCAWKGLHMISTLIFLSLSFLFLLIHEAINKLHA